MKAKLFCLVIFFLNNINYLYSQITTDEEEKNNQIKEYFKMAHAIEPDDCVISDGLREEIRKDYLSKIYDFLDISITLENQKMIYSVYKVLLNRPLQYDELIIGCGKVPHYGPLAKTLAIEHADHSHENVDTIDDDYAKNPSLVMNFGTTIFPPFLTRTYKIIHTNHICLFPYELISNIVKPEPYTFSNLLSLMDEDSIVNTGSKILTYDQIKRFKDEADEEKKYNK